jgi:hypothetical protein
MEVQRNRDDAGAASTETLVFGGLVLGGGAVIYLTAHSMSSEWKKDQLYEPIEATVAQCDRLLDQGKPGGEACSQDKIDDRYFDADLQAENFANWAAFTPFLVLGGLFVAAMMAGRRTKPERGRLRSLLAQRRDQWQLQRVQSQSDEPVPEPPTDALLPDHPPARLPAPRVTPIPRRRRDQPRRPSTT